MPKKAVKKVVKAKVAKKATKTPNSKAVGAQKSKISSEVAKKVASPKPTVEVTIKRSILGEAPEEYHFILKDGKKLKNVFELVDSLKDMHEEVFREHVNEVRNDFANWLEDIFNERSLAEELKAIEDRFETERKLTKKLIAELRRAAKV